MVHGGFSDFPYGHLVDGISEAWNTYPDARVIFLPRDSAEVRGFHTPEFQQRLREIHSATEMTRLVREYRREMPTWEKVCITAGIHALIVGAPAYYMGIGNNAADFSGLLAGLMLSPFVAGSVIGVCGAANNERGNVGAAILGSLGGIFAGEVAGLTVWGVGKIGGDKKGGVSAIAGIAAYSITAAICGVAAYNGSRTAMYAGYSGGRSGSVLDIDAAQGVATLAPPSPQRGLLGGFDTPHPVVRFEVVNIRF